MEAFPGGGWLVLLAVLWSIPWKGAALWKSARKGSRGWFIALLLVNTLGLLEILYIFFFSRTRSERSGARESGRDLFIA